MISGTLDKIILAGLLIAGLVLAVDGMLGTTRNAPDFNDDDEAV